MPTKNKRLQGLILSDLHLTIPKAELRQFGIEDAMSAIKQIKTIVNPKNTVSDGVREPAAPPAPFDFFVIAGDIFDSTSVDSVSIHLLCELRDALANIPEGYIIRGNHDRATYSMLSDLFGWIPLEPDKVSYVRNSDITISGINFCNDELHRQYLKSAPTDIMVLHLSMKPFGGFSENSVDVSECPTDRVVIVGDTHVPAAHMQNDRCVISPGNLFPLNKAELTSGNSGSCFILTISKDNNELDVDVSPVRLNSRKGASLISIETPDELLNSPELTRLTEPSGCKLKPVVYVRPELVDYVPDSVVAIGRSVGVVSDSDIMDIPAMDDSDMVTRIRTILCGFFSGDDNADDLAALSLDLISAEDYDEVIEHFIKQ